MKRAIFLNKLEEIMEAPEGSLTGDEKLSDLPRWDSMAVVQFIALVDEDFNMPVSASDLLQAQDLPDLMRLLGDKVTD